jgi:hypothetical protein
VSDKDSPPTKRPDIVDPHSVQSVFVDWIVTGGMFENVINVTLGTIDHSMKRTDADMARVVVASRLRCSREFGLRLYIALGNILGLPPASGVAPQDSPKPPSNLIN